MNKTDKIKALLADPSVESIGLQWSVGKIPSHLPCSHSDVDLDIADYGEIEDYQVNFHQWPEINEGDLVMTPNGEGKVCSIFNDRTPYYIQFAGAGGLQFERHELALLERGGDGE